MSITKEPITKMKLFHPTYPNKATSLINGKASGLLNWNDIAYPQMYTIFKRLVANHWVSDEISMQDDIKQWDNLTEEEQEVFLRVNTQLAALDGLQTETMLSIKDYITDSPFTRILAVISQQEAIHEESYSYILSSLIESSEQNKRYEQAKKDPLILKRNQLVLDSYEKFRETPSPQNLFEVLVNSINLEGIYFYAGFAFFYHLAKNQKMLNTTTMISYIQRDEMQHAYFISQLIRILLTEFKELNTEENINYIYETVNKAVELEKEWSTEIFKNISGIDVEEFHGYLEYLANKRFRQLSLDNYYLNREKNPMPWIQVYSDEMINDTKTDFFEQKSRTYTKVSSDNGFDEL